MWLQTVGGLLRRLFSRQNRWALVLCLVIILVMLFIPQGLVGWVAERGWPAGRSGATRPAEEA